MSKEKRLGLCMTVAVLAAGLSLFLGCTGKKSGKKDKRSARPAPRKTARPAGDAGGAKPRPLRPEGPAADVGMNPPGYEALERELRKVKPVTKPYTVKADLSNVRNARLFKKMLTADHRAMIAKSGFVVTPTDYTQMFHLYENNEYWRPYPFGAFITTDALLHTYHLFFDYSLRKLESGRLYGALKRLTGIMIKVSQDQAAAAKSAGIKDAARRNAAYFAVARSLLTGKTPPDDVKELVQPDLDKIKAHQGRAVSTVLGVNMDFTQFIPRGHYTRSRRLKRYFRAMMWLGLSGFPLPGAQTPKRLTVQALLMTRALKTAKRGKLSAGTLWEKIYEPTVFYVGAADDFTWRQYAGVMDKVFGPNAEAETLADGAKLKRFADAAKKLPAPRIQTAMIGIEGGRQFRFMGQRFIPDSRILQEMTHPKVKKRFFPRGLDVFAAMGSDRALQILKNTYREGRFRGYHAQMARMRAEMKRTPRKTWQSNLYWGWLWLLNSVVQPVAAGYPSFMRNKTWLDKSLFTALGSWTELRHDTILYAKQSGAQCGGDEEELKRPKGYVEPNLVFWTRLKWLTRYTRAGLSKRRLLTSGLKDKFDRLEEWVEFCRRITIKELTGKRVTAGEYNKMRYIGGELELFFKDFAGGQVISESSRDMAVVADVHTSFGKVLEEGTGRVGAIYVVVPIRGKLYLTRGAVFTHYEFTHPASDRLTDEKWRKMLKSGRVPPLAKWTRSFFSRKGKRPPKKYSNYLGGC